MLERLKAWRLAQKERQLTAERVQSFAAADVLVISFTKSGRTWLRVLISNYFARRFDLSEQELIDGANFNRQVAAIPKVFFAPDTRFPYPELGPAAVAATSEQKVVFLVRDPRDVAVSLYYHVKHRASDRELGRKKIPGAARELDLDAFVLDPDFGAARAIGYMNRWARERDRLTQSYVLRYEDLRADTAAAFSDLLRFLAQPATPELIADVIAFAAFDSLQQKEREGFFNSDRLGQRRAGDSTTGKVRQGRVGGYAAQLRPETRDALDRLVARELDPGYGYR